LAVFFLSRQSLLVQKSVKRFSDKTHDNTKTSARL
jgi:hypothetical protein